MAGGTILPTVVLSGKTPFPPAQTRPYTLSYNHPIADMTPEPQRPLKVFLCHAHADRDPVCGLYTRLTQDGVDAWLDREKLLPGQDGNWKFAR